MTVLLALIAHVGWAVGDIFGVVAVRKLGSVSMTVSRGITACLLATICALPFFWRDFFRLTPETLAIIVMLTLFTIIADFAFFESLKAGNPSVAGVISASFVAPAVLISILFLGEAFSLEKIGVIALILSGVLLCFLDRTTFRWSWGRSESMALVAMIGWGLYYALIKIPIASVGWFVPGYFFLLTFPVIAICLRLKSYSFQSPFSKSIFPAFIASVVLTSLAEWLYMIGIEGSDVSFVAPIAGSYPALFVLLSHLAFKEHIQGTQWIGICMTLIGIIALSALGA